MRTSSAGSNGLGKKRRTPISSIDRLTAPVADTTTIGTVSPPVGRWCRSMTSHPCTGRIMRSTTMASGRQAFRESSASAPVGDYVDQVPGRPELIGDHLGDWRVILDNKHSRLAVPPKHVLACARTVAAHGPVTAAISVSSSNGLGMISTPLPWTRCPNQGRHRLTGRAESLRAKE